MNEKYMKFKDGDISEVTSESDFKNDNLYKAIFDFPSKTAYLKHDLEAKAKELGGTNLVRMFKAQCTSYKKAADEANRELQRKRTLSAPAAHKTQYRDLPEFCTGNKLVGVEWETGDDGAYMIIESQAGTKVVTACHQPVLINRILRDMRGLDAEDERVEIVYETAKGWKKSVISRELLLNSSKAIQLTKFGINLDSSEAGAFTKYMCSMLTESEKADIIPILPSTSKLGWFGDDFTNFMPYDSKELIFSGESSIGAILDAIKPHGDRETWYDAFKEMRQQKQTYFQFATAAMLAGPILPMVNSLNGFVCDVYGNSGTGKSFATCIAASIFGSYRQEDGYVVSPETTDVGMEAMLDALNNIPMVIDDFNNQNDREKEKFPSKIMKMANGVGKTRSNINVGIRQMKYWNTSILISSEQDITMGATTDGARNRVLKCRTESTFVWKKDPTDLRYQELMSVFAENYGHAGRDYIKILQQIGRDGVKKIYNQFVIQIAERGRRANKSERQFQPLAVLMAADYIAAKYLFQDDIRIDINDSLEFIDGADDNNQYEQFYYYINDSIISTPGLFEGMAYDGERSREYAGIYQDEMIDGKSVTTVAMVPLYFNKLAKERDVDTKMFFSYLKEKNLLIHDKDRNTIKLKSKEQQMRIRFIKIILPDNMDDDIDDDEYMDVDASNCPFLE